jgi:hypothetical protein
MYYDTYLTFFVNKVFFLLFPLSLNLCVLRIPFGFIVVGLGRTGSEGMKFHLWMMIHPEKPDIFTSFITEGLIPG